jgi:hypothetical protein
VTQLLEKAIARAGGLPEDEQDSIASQILDSLADEAAWKKHFAGKRETLRRLAEEALEEDARGEALQLRPQNLL